MSDSVRLSGLFASTFLPREDKSSSQPGTSSFFGALLDDRRDAIEGLGPAAGGQPPIWSWGKAPTDTKLPVPQIANEAGDELLPMEGRDGTEAPTPLSGLWPGTRNSFNGQVAAGWQNTQGSVRGSTGEPRLDGIEDETEMAGHSGAVEAIADPEVVLPPAATKPVSTGSGDTMHRPDAILHTIDGKGGGEASGDPELRPETNVRMVVGDGGDKMKQSDLNMAALGDGRQQSGLQVARSSASARAEPEQTRPQPGDAAPSRTVDGRVAEVARLNASQLSGLQRPDPLAQRVRVISSHAMPPAPPMPAGQLMLPGTPASQIVSAIREDGELVSRAAAAVAHAQEASAANPRPVQSLQIQLHPTHLGQVTARMSVEGSRLHVELQVETDQARIQLANDKDAILKALKASGYEIDRVTIQQAPQAANAGSPSGQDRNAGYPSAQGGEANEAGGERRRREGGGGDNQPEGGSHEGRHADSARGGLYI